MKLYYYFVPWHSSARSFGVVADSQDKADILLQEYFVKNGWLRIIPASVEREEQSGQIRIVTPAQPERMEYDIPGWPGDYLCWTWDAGEVIEIPVPIRPEDLQA